MRIGREFKRFVWSGCLQELMQRPLVFLNGELHRLWGIRKQDAVIEVLVLPELEDPRRHCSEISHEVFRAAVPYEVRRGANVYHLPLVIPTFFTARGWARRGMMRFEVPEYLARQAGSRTGLKLTANSWSSK